MPRTKSRGKCVRKCNDGTSRTTYPFKKIKSKNIGNPAGNISALRNVSNMSFCLSQNYACAVKSYKMSICLCTNFAKSNSNAFLSRLCKTQFKFKGCRRGEDIKEMQEHSDMKLLFLFVYVCGCVRLISVDGSGTRYFLFFLQFYIRMRFSFSFNSKSRLIKEVEKC